MRHKALILSLVVIAFFLGAYFYGVETARAPYPNGNSQNKITSFDECSAAGNPVMESYPRRCQANGQTFTENVPDQDIRQTQFVLEGGTWTWVSAVRGDQIITPKKAGAFTLIFKNDGQVQIGTDCNNMGASYVAGEKNLNFSDISSTMMFCEGSQEQEFSSLLGEVTGYYFKRDGSLVLSLSGDSGSMLFSLNL